MALILEKVLYNGDVVRYHKLSAYVINPETGVVTAVLESFRDRGHRELPVNGIVKNTFDFRWSGNADTLANEAYAYIKTLPEWQEAVDM